MLEAQARTDGLSGLFEHFRNAAVTTSCIELMHRHLAPGERTGKFRLGADRLLVDGNGKSAISMEDFAIALVNELERPAHLRRRCTAGY